MRLHLAVIAACLALFVPCAGSYGLWDPWETHYAEVSRQMLVTGDAIDLQWNGAPDDHEFWSKPPLTFWCQAGGMAALGVDPDDVASIANETRAEWGVRLPGILFAVLGIWSVFFATRRLIGQRAGLFAAAICATTPLFALIARQAITDIYMAGTATAAIALAAVALYDEDDERPRGRPLVWVAGLALAGCVVPQLLALAQRVPAIEVAPYVAVLVGLAIRIALVRKRSHALVHLAYVLAGLSVLAKGAIGVGIALATIGAVVIVTRDWRGFLRLRPIDGLLTILLVAAPWHHAMYALHGMPFVIEFVLFHNWNRVGSGVYGERTGSLGYFLRELGYGLGPWLPLVAGALVAALRTRVRFVLLVVLWAAIAFATVAMSGTKFHHYILPVVPPFAILAGWFADATLRGEAMPNARAAILVVGLPVMALATAVLVAEPRAPEQIFWLFGFHYMLGPDVPWPALELRPLVVIVAALGGIAAIAFALGRWQRIAVASLFIVATAYTVALLDVVIPQAAETYSQKQVLAHFHRVREPEDRLYAFFIYMRGESFYGGGELYVRGWPIERATVQRMHEVGLVEWRRRNPGITTYVVTAWWNDIGELRRHFPDLRVAYANEHTKLIVLPRR